MIWRQKNRGLLLILFLTVFAGVSVLIAHRISTNAQTPPEEPTVANDPQGKKRPPRIVELDEEEWRQNVSLQTLAKESRLIAVAQPIRNVCRLSPNGKVTTDYEVKLQEVIKGDFQPDSLVSVSMPGGLIRDENGELLEVRAGRVRKMLNGKIYVLFLKKAGGPNNEFTPVRGSQGIYEIPRNGSRVIHLGRSWELPPSDDGELVSVFLQKVRLWGRE